MTKQELKQYYWTRKNIQELEQRLEELMALATKTTTQLTHDPIRAGGKTSDKVGNIVAEMEKVKQEIENQVEKSYKEMQKIEMAIQILPAREMYLIRSRYFDNKPWEQIAVDMNCSWRHIHRIHSEALKILGGRECLELTIGGQSGR